MCYVIMTSTVLVLVMATYRIGQEIVKHQRRSYSRSPPRTPTLSVEAIEHRGFHVSRVPAPWRQKGRIVHLRGKRIFAISTGLALALLGGVSTAQATAPRPTHQVTICHRTASADGGNQHNGYDKITVDIASVSEAEKVFNGPAGHDSHDQQGNGPGGDIIPAFTFDT